MFESLDQGCGPCALGNLTQGGSWGPRGPTVAHPPHFHLQLLKQTQNLGSGATVVNKPTCSRLLQCTAFGSKAHTHVSDAGKMSWLPFHDMP